MPKPSKGCEFVRKTGPILHQAFAASADSCRYCNKPTENYCSTHWDLAVCLKCEEKHVQFVEYVPCYCTNKQYLQHGYCPLHHGEKNDKVWKHWPEEKQKRKTQTNVQSLQS